MTTTVKAALDAPPADFSSSFEEAQKLADRFRVMLGCPVTLQVASDYTSAHAISVGVVSSAVPDPPWRVDIYLSLKGPLAMLALYQQVRLDDARARARGLEKGGAVWKFRPNEDVPTSLSAITRLITSVLGDAGVEVVEYSTLNDEVPGHERGLDGQPATVRDVLFSELI